MTQHTLLMHTDVRTYILQFIYDLLSDMFIVKHLWTCRGAYDYIYTYI